MQERKEVKLLIKKIGFELKIIEENLRTIEIELKLPGLVNTVTGEELEDQSVGLQELYQKMAELQEPLRTKLNNRIETLSNKYGRCMELLKPVTKPNHHLIDSMLNEVTKTIDALEYGLEKRPSSINIQKINAVDKELTALLKEVQTLVELQKIKFTQSIQNQQKRVNYLMDTSLLYCQKHSQSIKIPASVEEPNKDIAEDDTRLSLVQVNPP